MAMQVGSAKSKYPAPAINVTPLVDVVLVLLIIFMVITPLLEKKFWVHTPKEEKVEVERIEGDPPLVMQVEADGSVRVNGVHLQRGELAERLPRMFAARDDHVLFVTARDEVPYGVVVGLMDVAREAGAVTIAPLMTSSGQGSDGTDGQT